jgi:hypothetical protein
VLSQRVSSGGPAHTPAISGVPPQHVQHHTQPGCGGGGGGGGGGREGNSAKHGIYTGLQAAARLQNTAEQSSHTLCPCNNFVIAPPHCSGHVCSLAAAPSRVTPCSSPSEPHCYGQHMHTQARLLPRLTHACVSCEPVGSYSGRSVFLAMHVSIEGVRHSPLLQWPCLHPCCYPWGWTWGSPPCWGPHDVATSGAAWGCVGGGAWGCVDTVFLYGRGEKG